VSEWVVVFIAGLRVKHIKCAVGRLNHQLANAHANAHAAGAECEVI
jgi:hypothetical protein